MRDLSWVKGISSTSDPITFSGWYGTIQYHGMLTQLSTDINSPTFEYRRLTLQPMRVSVTTLKLLRELVKEPTVRPTFLQSPLCELSAFAALHFLELLVGPKAAGLSVKDPAKLGEYPPPVRITLILYRGAFIRRIRNDKSGNWSATCSYTLLLIFFAPNWI